MTHPFDGHQRIALSFSGGKDSLACVEIYRNDLDRITLYHMDTGDLLPEIVESVARVEDFAPHFVRVTGNVLAWQHENGLPTDLLPYSAHPVGQLMGQAHVRLMSRYDCCYLNLMIPLFERIRDDGNTLLIRGTKRVDMPRLPIADGENEQGVTMHYPLLAWSHDAVLHYLRTRAVPLPRVYEHRASAPECARCPAWWNEGRNAYLRQYYPQLWRDYRERLELVHREIAPSLGFLSRELE